MRLKTNQKFFSFNKSGEWNTKILSINKEIVEFEVQNQLRQSIQEGDLASVCAC